MPQVVGALLAGVILGPAVLDMLHETEFLDKLAEIGVIVLMFCAGLETDTRELKKSGKSAFIIALIGVIVPLAGGYAVAAYFNRPSVIASDASGTAFLQNMFIGVILTATSVSITVETLKELGKLKTHSGNAILGAAIIDDVLGIIALTIITSMADSNVNLVTVLLKIAAFFLLSGVGGVIVYRLFARWSNNAEHGLQRHTIAAFALCLILSFAAEKFFGVADITGAYIAGIVLCSLEDASYIERRVDISSYTLFAPVFFASIGLKTDISGLTPTILLFSACFVIVALLTKIIGCGLAAKACRFNWSDSLKVGVGMMTRGEVALIVAQKGLGVGVVDSVFFTAVILLIVVSSIVTPLALKGLFSKG